MATVNFGSVLDKPKSDKKVWLLAVPLIIAIVAALIWGFSTVSSADAARADLGREKAHANELQASLDQRDKLLTQAREDESVLKSAGQAASLFASVSPDATESGVVLGNTATKTARIFLYGLTTPPAGQQYVVAALGKNGPPTPLGRVLPDEQGNGFLLAKNVPEGTSAIQVLFAQAAPEGAVASAGAKGDEAKRDGEGRQPVQPGAEVMARQEGTGSGASGGEPPKGDQAKPATPAEPPISLEGATPRVSARYPAGPEERGILAQQPAQARRGRR